MNVDHVRQLGPARLIIIIIGILIVVAQAVAIGQGPELRITGATVDCDYGEIRVQGNFGAVAELAEFDVTIELPSGSTPLPVDLPRSTEGELVLELASCEPPGTYRLRASLRDGRGEAIKKSPTQSHNELDVALGAVGPRGDQGADGPIGPEGARGPAGADGIHCWDLDENHACDLSTEDRTNDGNCDVADCAGAEGPPGRLNALADLSGLQCLRNGLPGHTSVSVHPSTGAIELHCLAPENEVCTDGVDNDLDQLVDCDDPNCLQDAVCTACPDADGDGFFAFATCPGEADCNDGAASVFPGAPELCVDGLDNDCDGEFPLIEPQPFIESALVFLTQGDGLLSVTAPTSCTTPSIGGEVCVCPDEPNGCPVTLDFGRPPRVFLTTSPNGSEVEALFQPRAVANIPVDLEIPSMGILNCVVSYDTERTGAPTLDISATFLFTTDALSGTQVRIGSLDMALENDDFEITGCALVGGVAEVAVDFVIGQMEPRVENRLETALQENFEALVCVP